MSAVLSFSGADCLPVVGSAAEQERLLRAADNAAGPQTLQHSLALIALFCRGTSADIELTLIRLLVFFRAAGRRDVMSLLSPDPVAKALDIVLHVDAGEIRELYRMLKAVEPDAKEQKAEEKMLEALQAGDPCTALIMHFKADLAVRLKALFVVHRAHIGKDAAYCSSKRCIVEVTGYDDSRYKPRHWQSVVEAFAQRGVYPPAFLKEWVRLYRSLPWPESCRNLMGGSAAPVQPAPVRYRSASEVLAELLEGDLRPAETARLALNASALGIPGLYIPRCLWLELTWSLLDRHQRTAGLKGDLRQFEAGNAMSFTQVEVLA